MARRSLIYLGMAVLLLAGRPALLQSAEPEVRSLDLRGLQVGGTTRLVFEGQDFGKEPHLLFPFPARPERKEATDKKAVFEVTLGNEVAPGFYPVWLASVGGLSKPIVLAVDGLPERPLAPQIDKLPAALHGQVTGSSTVETTFQGQAGDKILVEVEAQRLGGKLRPVVHLHGPTGLQIGWAWPKPQFKEDCRLEAVLPASGEYRVTVHDVEYAGQNPGHFRLKVGRWAAVDQVFPPALPLSAKGKVTLFGPDLTTDIDVAPGSDAGPLPLPLPTGKLWSGPRPFVRVPAHPERVHPGGKTTLDLPGGTSGCSGRLQTPFEENLFRLPVEPGTKIRLEVLAERLGSPLDAALVIRNDKGGQLARGEDGPETLDPVLEYAVPAKTTSLLVAVVDAQGKGSPRGIYRLQTETVGAGAGAFRLFSLADGLAVPEGRPTLMPVIVERQGYDGQIELSATGLPNGVRLENTTIPADGDGTLVLVQRNTGAGENAVVRWTGVGGKQRRPVLVQGSPLEDLQPWSAGDLGLVALRNEKTGLKIAWRSDPAEALILGRKTPLAVAVERSDAARTVRLKLVTSQWQPLVNGKTDPNKSLKLEKAAEIAPKKNEGDLVLIIPPALPASVYDLTVQAELLSPDKKTVEAVAFAPVRRLPVRAPFVVLLDKATGLPVTIDRKKGAALKVPGTIRREKGWTGEVALAVTGLPAGARVDALTVKAGEEKFMLNLVLPANLPAGEIRGLKLIGTGPADPKQPNPKVASPEVELSLQVQAAS